MAGVISASGPQTQRQLSEFLYAELLHTLGVYNETCKKLTSLSGDLKGVEGSPTGAVERRLKAAAEDNLHCNTHLRDQLHHPADANGRSISRRQPSPFPEGEKPAYPTASLLRSISDFYADVIAALEMHLRNPKLAERDDAPPGHILGARLAYIHDPHRRRANLSIAQRRRLIKGKIERIKARQDDVKGLLPPAQKDDDRKEEQSDRFKRLLEGDASSGHSLLLVIIQAMGEAHMWMHEAEHVQSQSFGDMIVSVPETHKQAQDMLRYSRALNWFVFIAARTSPWIFAEDEAEREYVISNYEICVQTLAPTYCMWISAQFSLLALHRRAFTFWTMGRQEDAYRDFHKLIRLLRDLRKPAERRGLRVPGTNTFIEGITAMAELHIGRIYRGQHAHKMALRYFERAAGHLKDWEDHEEIGELVKSSHWRLNLLINEGKAQYQLGHVKRSILSYARAWRAYLQLVEVETHATANLEVVEEFTGWLERIVDDPDLNRTELRSRIEPLVEQFTTLRTPPHLRLLAADIVMRMGHLLFVLKLPPAEWGRKKVDRPRKDPPASDHDLAARCLAKAAFFDPTSTRTAADLLKIEDQTREEVERPDENGKPAEISLAEQWPSVTGRFEESAQVTEYVLQRWLKDVKERRPKAGDRKKNIAWELLSSFLAHTDSSNVKLAQVYRYLTQGKPERAHVPKEDYSLDFVCMRRYSSFFPFLPRPSAFRAPGGGYFVQVREGKEPPFGIAIDPGPDFIENLYRCGYAVVDIQMIVITHDHADHIASLDALLTLMFSQQGVGETTFKRKGTRLVIVGNDSVCRRYEFFNLSVRKHFKRNKHRIRVDPVHVMSFEEIAEITSPEGEPAAARLSERIAMMELEDTILAVPRTLRIEPVRTWGHIDATGFVSQGFLLSVGSGGDRASILFTGDTGAPRDLALDPDADRPEQPDLLAKGSKSMRKAIEEADVVVAHLSSVPLRELRSLAGLDAPPGVAGPKLVSEYANLWAQAAGKLEKAAKEDKKDPGIKEAEFLLKQIQFGFRVRPKNVNLGVAVSPFSDPAEIREQPREHLYLSGLMEVAEAMAAAGRERGQLLLLGELREELGTFRTSIATSISNAFFKGVPPKSRPSALTADIGLRVRLTRTRTKRGVDFGLDVLCTTCDLDNDLVPCEQFHSPSEIREVCVKGEDEGVFYNCLLHDPRLRDEYLWVEAVERYDVFGE